MYTSKIITLSNKKRKEIAAKNLQSINTTFSQGYDHKSLVFKQIDNENYVLFDEGRLKINSDLFLKETNRNWFRVGEIGAFIAHYVIWKNMVENNIPYMLIFEDDCKPCSTFEEQNIKKIIDEIDDSVDIVYLQSVSAHLQDKTQYVTGRKNECLISVNEAHPNIYWFLEGVASYLITLSGAKKLLEDTTKNGWYAPIDNMMAKNAHFNRINIVVPTNLNDFFTLDDSICNVSQTHSGNFVNSKMIGNLFVQYRENEEIQYA